MILTDMEAEMKNANDRTKFLQHPGLSLKLIFEDAILNDEVEIEGEKAYLDILNHMQQSIESNNKADIKKNITKLQDYLKNYNAETFEEHVWLIEKAAICFLSTTEFSLLQKEQTWNLLLKSIKESDLWAEKDNYLQIISEKLFDLLENNKNRMYFIEKVSSIRTTSSTIICHMMAWAVLNDIVNVEVTDFRLYNFSYLMYILNGKINLQEFKQNDLQFYRLLECISTIYHLYDSKFHERDDFDMPEAIPFLRYSNEDMEPLYQWCSFVSESLQVNLGDNSNFNLNYVFMKELLDLDLLFFLEMALHEIKED